MVELVHDASWDLRKSTSWGSRCPSRSRPNQISSWPFSVLWSPTCQPARLPVHGLSRLSAWWVALGIDLERGRPAHPQDNGGHERLHRDIAEELESLGQGATPEALELWREEFNRERPHEALGMRCPAELYRDSSRRYRAAEVQLSYPGMATRLVDKNGKLSWKKQKVFLSGSLAGWQVGLQRTEKGQLEIWFGRLLLGHLDPQEVDFLRSQEAS